MSARKHTQVRRVSTGHVVRVALNNNAQSAVEALYNNELCPTTYIAALRDECNVILDIVNADRRRYHMHGEW